MKFGRKRTAVILGIFGILFILTAPGAIDAQMDDSGIAKAFKGAMIR